MQPIATIFVFILIAVIIPFGNAFGTDYYVAKNGNDSNPGTEARPWGTIQKAANRLVAGDTVYIKKGTYKEIVTPRNSGSSGSYITYSAYPGDRATIDGKGLFMPEYDGLFNVRDKSFIKVLGMRMINAGSLHDNYGISVENSIHIIIEKNYTYNTFSSGIIVWGSTNITIDGNEVELACNGGAQSSNEAISVGETDIFEIKNNHVHHGNTVRGEGIDAKDGSSNGSIHDNIVDHVMFVGIYIDAWDKHTYNIDVFRNRVHDIAGDGFSVGSEQGGRLNNVRFFNNIAYRNKHVGITVHNCCTSNHPLNNIQILNNTFYNNGWNQWGGGILIENRQAENVIIRNNISSNNLSFQIALEEIGPAGVTVDHNLIHGYRGYTGEVYGNAYVKGDPKFKNVSKNNFHLQENSPAIDNGSPIKAPNDDFDKNQRPRGIGYDMGAYEYTE